MKKRYVDPFSPDLPIDDPKRFSGRSSEINEVVDSLFQLSHENPVHTIITWDRGIGKSSVLNQVKALAEGNRTLIDMLDLDTWGVVFNHRCVWHDCLTSDTPAIVAHDVLGKIQTGFETLLGKLNFKINIWGFEVSGKDDSKLTLSGIVDRFCTELKKISTGLNSEKGMWIVIFFDELDRIDPATWIASFFKMSAERLSREWVKNIAFFAAGITGAIQDLEKEHASIYRIFKDIPLPRLKKEEVGDLLSGGFKSVNATFDQKVLERIFDISAGYPEPVHLLWSQILKVDKDDHLDLLDYEDAKASTIESLRKNKLSDLLKSAGSWKYQLIIGAMANYKGTNVPLSHISEKIGYEQNQYSTNMSALVKRNIISQVDRWVYCFVDPLLKEYVSKFGVIKADESGDIES